MEPLLIKPNDDELLDIFGIKVSGGDDESVKGAMAELHAKGAKNVLLTSVAPVRTSQRRAHLVCQSHLRRQAAVDGVRRRFLARCLPVRMARRSRARRGCPPSVDGHRRQRGRVPGPGDFAKVDEYKKHIEVRQVC